MPLLRKNGEKQVRISYKSIKYGVVRFQEDTFKNSKVFKKKPELVGKEIFVEIIKIYY